MRYLVVLFIFVLSVFADNISLDTFNQLKVIREKGIKVLGFKKLDSLYILRGSIKRKNRERAIIFYMTSDLESLILGRAFDKQNQRLYIPKDMTEYKRYANFSYGSGEREYFLFTDPQCPFCKKFEKMLLEQKDLKDKVSIYYFLYPLARHKEAIAMSEYILAKKDRLKALKEVVVDGSLSYKGFSNTKGKMLEKNMQIAFEMVVKGTPNIFDINGKPINYQEFFKNFK